MSYQSEIILKFNNEDGEDEEHIFPAINEVCSRCEGFGCHLTPSIGQHAYSQEEFNDSFDDEEDRQAYFTRGGIYDVQCEVCHGEKVVLAVDEPNLNEDQKKIYAKFLKHERLMAKYDAEDRATRRMENGGYDYY